MTKFVDQLSKKLRSRASHIYHAIYRLETNDFRKLAVRHQLRKAGISRLGITKSESRGLHEILPLGEKIEAAMIGGSRRKTLAVATDRHVLLLRKNPLYIRTEMIDYQSIGEIEITTHLGLFNTLILFTDRGNYRFSFVNNPSARNFIASVEPKSLEYNHRPFTRLDKVIKAAS